MKADLRDITFVGVRLMGFFVLARGLLALPSLAQLFTMTQVGVLQLLLAGVLILAPCLIGVALIRGAAPISRLVIARDGSRPTGADQSDPGAPESSDGVIGAVFAAAGLVIIAEALPMLAYTVHSLLESTDVLGEPLTLASDPRVWPYGAVMLLGVSLFIGAPFWSRAYRALRTFGLDR